MQAFEAQAIDYLLKPVQPGRLRKTVLKICEATGLMLFLLAGLSGLLKGLPFLANWLTQAGGFFGTPVAFGPNYAKFKEARDLVTLGAARPVKNYDELRTWFIPLRDNEDFLQKTSRIAKDYTTRHQGATNIIVKTIFH